MHCASRSVTGSEPNQTGFFHTEWVNQDMNHSNVPSKRKFAVAGDLALSVPLNMQGCAKRPSLMRQACWTTLARLQGRVGYCCIFHVNVCMMETKTVDFWANSFEDNTQQLVTRTSIVYSTQPIQLCQF